MMNENEAYTPESQEGNSRKWRRRFSRKDDSGDTSLGLTQAFAPLDEKDFDSPIGLTEAFGPIEEEYDDEGADDQADSWDQSWGDDGFSIENIAPDDVSADDAVSACDDEVVPEADAEDAAGSDVEESEADTAEEAEGSCPDDGSVPVEGDGSDTDFAAETDSASVPEAETADVDAGVSEADAAVPDAAEQAATEGSEVEDGVVPDDSGVSAAVDGADGKSLGAHAAIGGGSAALLDDDLDDDFDETAAAAEATMGAHMKGAHVKGFNYKGDEGEDYPDAFERLEPDPGPPLLMNEESVVVENEGGSDQGKKELHPVIRKSRRVRRTLIVIIIILIALAAALGYFGYRFFSESQSVAQEQAQTQAAQTAENQTIASEEAEDVTPHAQKSVEEPNLAAILGFDLDQALVKLGHGAKVSSSSEVADEESVIKQNVTVKLENEPADAKTGKPTVFLGLNEAGQIVQAGYSTSMSSLGFGDVSFADAVRSERAIEKTLQACGIPVADGVAVLPDDKNAYSTYAADQKTLTQEHWSFSGPIAVSGADCTWSSVLSYDYSTANLTGNLSDTLRVIYVYVEVA